MLIGYEWIFDADSEAVQKDQHQALINAGVDPSHIYSDTNMEEGDRPGLTACLNALQPRDLLVVWQLERLVDSRAYLVTLLQELQKRNVGLKVLTGHGAILDTTHVDLKLAIDMVIAVNDLETKILRRRTIAAHAVARERGQQIGGQRKVTPKMLRKAMEEMTGTQRSMTVIAAEMGITRATLYNYLHGDGSLKPAGEELLAEENESQGEP